MKHLLGPLAVLMVQFGCATINYIGESYPPTEHVDLYFSEADIDSEYTVVGRIVATANADEVIYSGDKFTQAILKKAREKGADGVVILGFGKVMTGTSTTRERTEKTEEKGDKTITREYESVSSSSEEKRRIEALAIKYKSR
ncbi:MAG: hypothetical protein ACE5H0_05220 [Bacteroidota bacterium]